jgi:hypothetical protein
MTWAVFGVLLAKDGSEVFLADNWHLAVLASIDCLYDRSARAGNTAFKNHFYS